MIWNFPKYVCSTIPNQDMHLYHLFILDAVDVVIANQHTECDLIDPNKANRGQPGNINNVCVS